MMGVEEPKICAVLAKAAESSREACFCAGCSLALGPAVSAEDGPASLPLEAFAGMRGTPVSSAANLCKAATMSKLVEGALWKVGWNGKGCLRLLTLCKGVRVLWAAVVAVCWAEVAMVGRSGVCCCNVVMVVIEAAFRISLRGCRRSKGGGLRPLGCPAWRVEMPCGSLGCCTGMCGRAHMP